MRKARELAAYLIERVASLAADPSRLVVKIPKGSIACRISSLSFEWRYDLEILAMDFSGEPDELIVPMLSWIAVNQPALLQNPDDQKSAIRVEAELIDRDKTDVLLTVTLTERVLVSKTDTGVVTNHLPEPALDDLTGPSPWTLFLNGQEVTPLS